ncbi:co-chaperone GroES [Caryophanon latum]|uniref:Co-chaperonin GroES n=1 Tax=Caryophanon latum TaxID=33977 RepID=A0A1C0YP52_9BACL|nr:co-chaperone GroES [Caryophanon latum]OCS88948.1 co-chaperone GroES [Caryophanon latum]
MLRPLGDRIIIELQEAEQTTSFGIIVPDSAKEKPQEGVVVAVGAGRVLDNGTRAELDVKVNDRIIFEQYAGTEVKYDGKEYLILDVRNILAIVED